MVCSVPTLEFRIVTRDRRVIEMSSLMSAFGGKADIGLEVPRCLLLTQSGGRMHLLVVRTCSLFDLTQKLLSAVTFILRRLRGGLCATVGSSTRHSAFWC